MAPGATGPPHFLAAIRLATFATDIPTGVTALGGLLVATAAASAAFLVLDRG